MNVVVSLSGRVAQNIKLFETSNDSHVITINLAVKSDYYKAGEEPKPIFSLSPYGGNWLKTAPLIL